MVGRSSRMVAPAYLLGSDGMGLDGSWGNDARLLQRPTAVLEKRGSRNFRREPLASELRKLFAA